MRVRGTPYCAERWAMKGRSSAVFLEKMEGKKERKKKLGGTGMEVNVRTEGGRDRLRRRQEQSSEKCASRDASEWLGCLASLASEKWAG